MTIPLFSDFLDYSTGDQEKNKQDCELKAFYRLTERLKEYFPRLPILLLLDGLYANGPVLELCRRYHWQFMIVLQDESLRSVWEEFRGLGQLERQNHLERNWGNRKQRFRWVNRIEYRYGERERKKQILHVVVCEESWEAIDGDSPAVVQKTARHAWISSVLLNRENVHERCNLGARHRWGIEEGILLEASRLWVRARLFLQLGGHAGLSLPHANRASAEHPGRTQCSSGPHGSEPGVAGPDPVFARDV